ncbi:MAG: tetratricopeptide repeat protein [Deltaproteobacteria bacterium]|nr:tetratricopeptide repeat protein [Deltaproteobacteria bacterium]
MIAPPSTSRSATWRGRVRARRAAALVALAALAAALAWPSESARAPTWLRGWRRRRSRGPLEDAASGFLACAARAPNPGEQAWGLSRAARVLATKLFRFDEALTILDRLARDFPTDPRAMAAQGLAMVIRDGRAAGDDPLRVYYTLLERPDLIAKGERAATLRRLVAEHPSFPYADAAMRLLAIELRSAGDHDGALAVLADMRARFAGQPAAATAVLETGATYFADGRFTEAAAWYRKLADFGGSAALGEQSARRALAHRARQRVAWLGTAAAVAWAAWVASATRWPRIDGAMVGNAARELTVLAPAWLLLVMVSFRTSPGIHRPIWWIGGATAAVLVLSNLCLLTRRPRGAAGVLHAVLTVSCVIAIVYLSFYRYDLVFTLEETLRFGPGVS